MTENPFANIKQLSSDGVEEHTSRSGGKKEPTSFTRGEYDDVEIYNITEDYPTMKGRSVIGGFAQSREALDTSWINVTFGVKQGTRKGFLKVSFPTESLSFSYKGRQSDREYKKLVDFFAALGIKTNRETLLDNIKALFNNVAVLEGSRIKITVGFKGAHIEWKKELGNTPYVVVDAKDNVLSKDSEGQDLGFNTRDAAQIFAKDNNLFIQDWPEILYVNAASTPCKVDLAKNVNVKKEVKKVTKNNDLPF